MPRGRAAEISAAGGAGVGADFWIPGDETGINAASYSERLSDEVPMPGRKSRRDWACDQLRFAVPGLCLGWPGKRAGKRCKRLINKPIEHLAAAENPRVGGSIPSLVTT